MDSLEPKKLALLRILQILQDDSDCDHPLKQEEIADILTKRYGIEIERKAIGRNLSLLREAGYDIESDKRGSYLAERTFEDSELHLLIDGVLASQHVSAKHSKELIEKISSLSNRYFRRHIKNVYSVNDWNKTENKTLFYSIDVIDEAIEREKEVEYDYNKYGADKKLHKTSVQKISPYQLILHNQRYYLMGYIKRFDHMVFHRLDRITNIKITDEPRTPLCSIKGYEEGIDYKRISASMPYMYADQPEHVTFIAEKGVIDQVVDWFGKGAAINETDGEKYLVTVSVSPNAMVYWALQYSESVTIVSPESVKERVKSVLKKAIGNYDNDNKKE